MRITMRTMNTSASALARRSTIAVATVLAAFSASHAAQAQVMMPVAPQENPVVRS